MNNLNRTLELAGIKSYPLVEQHPPFNKHPLLIESNLFEANDTFLVEIQQKVLSPLLEFNQLLVEAQLSDDQIAKIFDDIETGLNNSSSIQNRTFIGKGKDAINSIRQLFENPNFKNVEGFSEKVDKALQDIETREELDKEVEGGVRTKTEKLKDEVKKLILKYRKWGLKHPMLQGILMAVIAILAGLFFAGALGPVIASTVKFIDRMLMGEGLKSSLWKSVFAAGLGATASYVGHLLSFDPSETFASFFENNTEAVDTLQNHSNELAKLPNPEKAIDMSSIVTNPAPEITVDKVSFGEAFKYAREHLGANQVFNYNGHLYTTNISGTSTPTKDVTKILGKLIGKSVRELADMNASNAFKGADLAQKLLSVNEEVEVQSSDFDMVFEGLEETSPVLLVEFKFLDAVVKKFKTFGHNLTTTATSDNLYKAWLKTDQSKESEDVKNFTTKFLVKKFGDEKKELLTNIVNDIFDKQLKADKASKNAMGNKLDGYSFNLSNEKKEKVTRDIIGKFTEWNKAQGKDINDKEAAKEFTDKAIPALSKKYEWSADAAEAFLSNALEKAKEANPDKVSSSDYKGSNNKSSEEKPKSNGLPSVDDILKPKDESIALTRNEQRVLNTLNHLIRNAPNSSAKLKKFIADEELAPTLKDALKKLLKKYNTNRDALIPQYKVKDSSKKNTTGKPVEVLPVRNRMKEELEEIVNELVIAEMQIRAGITPSEECRIVLAELQQL